MLIEKRIEPFDRVPDTEPRPPRLVLPSAIVTVPENDMSDWVICHDIWPGPDESDAEPLHVPVSVPGAEAEGWVGREDDPPLFPLQPPADTSSSTPTRRKSNGRWFRVVSAMATTQSGN